MQQTRRVHTVRLTASDEGLVRRGAILLEDALHVASLPETEGGRLVVIRSLEIGRIRTSRPSASVALTIEQRVRMLSAGAVYAEDPAAPTALAVYFHADVEPFSLLATRVASQSSTDAWFWPLAVPVWRRDMGRDEALRVLLYGIMETRAGVAAAIALVGELYRQGAIEPLLSALRWSDGPTLLHAFRWTGTSHLPRVAIPGGARFDERVPADWTATYTRWIRQWGETDARTLWLTAVILAVERPARLLDAGLGERARRVLQAIMAENSAPAMPVPPGERNGADVPEARAEGGDAPADLHRTLDHPAIWTVEGRGVRDERAGAGHVRTTPSDDLPEAIAPHRPERGGSSKAELREDADPDIVGAGGAESSAHSQSEHRERAHRHAREGTEPKRGWEMQTKSTRFAGLFFLLSALSRLGIENMLSDFPDLLELDLPDRVLREVARRLRIPARDPVLEVPAAISSGSAAAVREFTVPTRWLTALPSEGTPRIRRCDGRPGERVLYDASGRLPLALWHGGIPDAVRAFLIEGAVRRDTQVIGKTGMAVLLDAWILALRRWSRRYGGLSLRDLVYRQGEISWTRTHLDVLFDHQSIDIRIRKAGLDLDPGWIPWFGRVVSFHYLYGDESHGID